MRRMLLVLLLLRGRVLGGRSGVLLHSLGGMLLGRLGMLRGLGGMLLRGLGLGLSLGLLRVLLLFRLALLSHLGLARAFFALTVGGFGLLPLLGLGLLALLGHLSLASPFLALTIGRLGLLPLIGLLPLLGYLRLARLVLPGAVGRIGLGPLLLIVRLLLLLAREFSLRPLLLALRLLALDRLGDVALLLFAGLGLLLILGLLVPGLPIMRLLGGELLRGLLLGGQLLSRNTLLLAREFGLAALGVCLATLRGVGLGARGAVGLHLLLAHLGFGLGAIGRETVAAIEAGADRRRALRSAGLGVRRDEARPATGEPLRRQRARRRRGGGDDRGGALGIGLALRALLLELSKSLLVLLSALVVDLAPFGVAVALLAPALLIDQHVVPTGPPVAGIGRAALIVDGRIVQVAGAEQVLGGHRQQGRRIVLIGPAVGVVDLHQFAVVVGVAIVRIAHVERIVAVSAVVVDPLAVGRVLDHAIFAVVGTPDPGRLAFIFHRVVRRAVRERVVQIIGCVDVAVDGPPRTRDASDGRRGRQGLRQGRGDLRRRRGAGQRQAGDRRARHGLRAVGLVTGRERQAGGRGGGQQEKAV